MPREPVSLWASSMACARRSALRVPERAALAAASSRARRSRSNGRLRCQSLWRSARVASACADALFMGGLGGPAEGGGHFVGESDGVKRLHENARDAEVGKA